ncbi:hypothetical protein BKA70DRAFT_1415463 [Coprinopsis sp. MPI-PUGE-AT-0042]|nr:hypothetical protein BKA70DRAFT_1415463 [Coprinopsis sp. MPI-PUGE-AT-0042]
MLSSTSTPGFSIQYWIYSPLTTIPYAYPSVSKVTGGTDPLGAPPLPYIFLWREQRHATPTIDKVPLRGAGISTNLISLAVACTCCVLEASFLARLDPDTLRSGVDFLGCTSAQAEHRRPDGASTLLIQALCDSFTPTSNPQLLRLWNQIWYREVSGVTIPRSLRASFAISCPLIRILLDWVSYTLTIYLLEHAAFRMSRWNLGFPIPQAVFHCAYEAPSASYLSHLLGELIGVPTSQHIHLAMQAIFALDAHIFDTATRPSASMDADPRLLPFLTSNHALPDQLLPALNGYLDHLARCIQACDHDMNRPIGGDVKLKRLQDEHDEFSSLKAPIRRVPGEILAGIIHWAIGGPGYFINAVERETFLRLRQVSTLWRSTAFSTPFLWRYLRLEVETRPDEDPYPEMLAFGRLIARWFGRAGHEAKVHLAFGGRIHSNSYRVDWMGVVWGLEERSYRLTAVLLWGNGFAGVGEQQLQMPHVANVSIPSGATSLLQIRFAGLESLELTGSGGVFPFLKPFQHSNLRSLFLSHLHLGAHDIVMTIKELPRLTELIIHTIIAFKPAGDAIQETIHSSIERLICTQTVLFHWPKIQLPSLKFFKLVRDNIDQVERLKEEMSHWDGFQHVAILPEGADPLTFCDSKNLTLDLTSSGLELENLIPFLQRL